MYTMPQDTGYAHGFLKCCSQYLFLLPYVILEKSFKSDLSCVKDDIKVP